GAGGRNGPALVLLLQLAGRAARLRGRAEGRAGRPAARPLRDGLCGVRQRPAAHDGHRLARAAGAAGRGVDAQRRDLVRLPADPPVPEWTLSGGIQYAFELFGDPDQTLTPRLDWSYQSHRTNGAVNQPNTCPDECIPSYHVFNGRLTYDNLERDFSVSLSATNLFDEFYWQQLGAAVTATGGVPTARTGVPSEPRMVKLTVSKRF